MVRFILWLFSSKKSLIYTALNSQDYSQAIAKLIGVVPYRIFIQSGPWMGGGIQSESSYYIYVKKEDVQRAMEAINRKN